ncbi:transaldolase [Pleurocapsales cyanobacterium LEGE 10410]|nr:transaldolase [Pleurocapsales cyanobacterium LEGE 10410]
MTNNNPLLEINNYGQSVWMDNLSRSLIESGELEQQIENYGLKGITSNPAIFEKAIAGNQVYDADIEAGIKVNKPVSEIYETLIFKDIRDTCDCFKEIYEQTGGLDGYVSIEVSPHLARDTEGTVEEALRYYKAIERENVMIKIPGTPEGFPAIERVITEGINVNVTLLFSVESYQEAAWAYIRGLETRIKRGLPIDKIASVASFFLSRIDVKIDDRINERLKNIGTETLNEEARLRQVQGKVAIANAKLAYQKFREITQSDRWKALADRGANIQRLLWASTSTKNPEYNDVMYVNELVGEHTVNTLPPNTLDACADHCEITANPIESNVEEAKQLIASLQDPDINIDLKGVMEELLEEGIDKFVRPFDSLQQTLEEKVKQLATA